MSNERIKPLWAFCPISDCWHAWPVTYTPADLSRAAAILAKSVCPMCGHDRPQLARQDNGMLLEPEARSTLDILVLAEIERRVSLLDEGMRTTPAYAAEELRNQGRVGLTNNLRRLQEWLDGLVGAGDRI